MRYAVNITLSVLLIYFTTSIPLAAQTNFKDKIDGPTINPKFIKKNTDILKTEPKIGGKTQGVVIRYGNTAAPIKRQPKPQGFNLKLCQTSDPNSARLTVVVPKKLIYRTLLPGSYCMSGINALLDFNKNGEIDDRVKKPLPGRPTHNHYFISENGNGKIYFPRIPRLLGVSGKYVLDHGSRYGQTGGIVIWGELSSWKSVFRRQFIALHLALTKNTKGEMVATAIGLFAGDANHPAILPNNRTSDGIVMSDTGNTPLKLTLDKVSKIGPLPGAVPPGGGVYTTVSGRLKGAVDGFVRFVDINQNIYAAQINFAFDVKLYTDCSKKYPQICN